MVSLISSVVGLSPPPGSLSLSHTFTHNTPENTIAFSPSNALFAVKSNDGASFILLPLSTVCTVSGVGEQVPLSGAHHSLSIWLHSARGRDGTDQMLAFEFRLGPPHPTPPLMDVRRCSVVYLHSSKHNAAKAPPSSPCALERQNYFSIFDALPRVCTVQTTERTYTDTKSGALVFDRSCAIPPRILDKALSIALYLFVFVHTTRPSSSSAIACLLDT